MNARHEVVVGVVGAPWGTRGQFLLDPRGSEMEFVLSRPVLRLRTAGGDRIDRALAGWLVAGGKLVVGIEGCATPEAAARLRGAEVLMPAEAFPAPPEGSFYPHQLAGLSVVRTDGAPIGTVERVVETAGSDLLEVRAGSRTILIPFVEAICRVDAGRNLIEVDPPEGLLELDAS
jgi:16S rRNA processing protein RimM